MKQKEKLCSNSQPGRDLEFTQQIPVWGTIFSSDSQFPPSDQSNLGIHPTSLEGHCYHRAWAPLDVQYLHPTVLGRQNMLLPQGPLEEWCQSTGQPRAEVFQAGTVSSFPLKSMLHSFGIFFLGTQNWKKDANKNPALSSETRPALSNVLHWFSSVFFPLPQPVMLHLITCKSSLSFFFLNASQRLHCQNQSHDWRDIVSAASFCSFCYR